MKKVQFLKESLEGILVSLLLSFMLAFYEPFNMYAGNSGDFWFDLYDFLPIIFVQFLVLFLLLAGTFVVINVINKKAYRISLLFAFSITLALYIQGNFLAFDLPSIDGNQINWEPLGLSSILSIIVWAAAIVVPIIILCKKELDKSENIKKTIKFVSVGVFAVLLVTTASLVVKPGVLDHKNTEVAMFDNFDTISNDKNFLIFLTDQVDSQAFDKELSKNWDKTDIFEDFTYYPDTSSTYLWTIFSVPYILSGEYNENKEPAFTDYFTRALDNAPLLQRLEKEGYEMNIYEDEELLNYRGDKLQRFKNIQPNSNINKKELIKQEIKYTLFKYLPYPLKKIAKIENLDFNRTKIDNDGRIFSSFNDQVYNHIKSNDLTNINNKYFSFVHVVGAHPPFVYNSEVVRQPEGTYEDGINASIAMVKAYLERLKQNGTYDNSVIIIMSDHGHSDETIGRSNPILYIKGLNEKHDYRRSDAKVSYENLNAIYEQLLDGAKTDDLLKGVDNSKRRVLYNELHNATLTEYIQTGNAWDTSTLIKTGNQYERN